MIQYRVSYNEEYILGSLEQYRRQRQVYPWFIALKIACALGLALLIGIVVYGAIAFTGKSGPLVLIALVLAVFLILLLQGPRLDYLLLKRRLRKSPFYGDEICIAISEEGMSFEAPKSQTHLKWSAFTYARRVGTGFLVFTDPKVAHWLPDSALTTGTPVDVESMLRKNVVAFEGK